MHDQEKGPEMKGAKAETIRIKNFKIEAGENIPAEVVQHVQNNLVLATNESSICVDGGYQPDEAMGELARAGGDLGISMALLKMGLTPEQAFLTVYNYRFDNGQKYGWHSDKHVDPDNSDHDHHGSDAIVGCGHCNAAYKNADRYGVSSDSVKQLLEIIKLYQKEYPENMRYVNLDRNHDEKGILVVKSTDVSVLPWDLQTYKQFFVYDAARDEILLGEIAEKALAVLTAENPMMTLEKASDELKKIVSEQTNTTLGLLESSKGKPMYAINYSDGTVTIELTGYAPQA